MVVLNCFCCKERFPTMGKLIAHYETVLRDPAICDYEAYNKGWNDALNNACKTIWDLQKKKEVEN